MESILKNCGDSDGVLPLPPGEGGGEGVWESKPLLL
jgi:hypothetical protein